MFEDTPDGWLPRHASASFAAMLVSVVFHLILCLVHEVLHANSMKVSLVL